MFQLCTLLIAMSIVSRDCESNRVNRLQRHAEKQPRSAEGACVVCFGFGLAWTCTTKS